MLIPVRAGHPHRLEKPEKLDHRSAAAAAYVVAAAAAGAVLPVSAVAVSSSTSESGSVIPVLHVGAELSKLPFDGPDKHRLRWYLA